MPPRVPASTKGKESTATSSTSSSSATATAARRTPVGKVIHFFVDTQGSANQQGYDGQKFSEAYQTKVLPRALDGGGAGAGAKANESGTGSGSSPAQPDEEDVKTIVQFAGLSKAEAEQLFKGNEGKDISFEAACRAYLQS